MDRSLSRFLLSLLLFLWTALACADQGPAPAANDAWKEQVAMAASLLEQYRPTEALKELKQAYVTHKEPRLLFLLSRAHEQLGEIEEAHAYYQYFLEADPHMGLRRRAQVENRITVLGRLIQAAKPAPPLPPTLQPPALSTASPPSAPTYSFRIGGLGIEAVERVEGKERVAASLFLPGKTYALLHVGGLLYVARGILGITVIGVTDPEHPTRLFNFATEYDVVGMSLSGKDLMVRLSDGTKLLVFDVSSPTGPRILRTILTKNVTKQGIGIGRGGSIGIVLGTVVGAGLLGFAIFYPFVLVFSQSKVN